MTPVILQLIDEGLIRDISIAKCRPSTITLADGSIKNINDNYRASITWEWRLEQVDMFNTLRELDEALLVSVVRSVDRFVKVGSRVKDMINSLPASSTAPAEDSNGT